MSGGTTIAYNGPGTTRTIAIGGIHRVLTGPRGTVWFDHSLETTTDLTVTGTRALGTRTITAGAVKLYHNRAEYTATSTFDGTNQVKWGSSSCCYPTAGKITTVLTGSLTGSMSLEFTSTCGSALFTDRDGSTSTVSLNTYQCQ